MGDKIVQELDILMFQKAELEENLNIKKNKLLKIKKEVNLLEYDYNKMIKKIDRVFKKKRVQDKKNERYKYLNHFRFYMNSLFEDYIKQEIRQEIDFVMLEEEILKRFKSDLKFKESVFILTETLKGTPANDIASVIGIKKETARGKTSMVIRIITEILRDIKKRKQCDE